MSADALGAGTMIARLRPANRLAVLQALVSGSEGPVSVDYSALRDPETAHTIRGLLITVGHNPAGACTDLLVIRPMSLQWDAGLRQYVHGRLHCLPASHIVRVRIDGHVLAGSPMTGGAES